MQEDFRIEPSVLADLGPLPEVVETDSDTAWDTFVQLVAQHSPNSSGTTPSQRAEPGRGQPEDRWVRMDD